VQISGWDIAVTLAKAITYGATLTGSGGIFFLAFNEPLRRERRGEHIAKTSRTLLFIAAGATVVKVLLAAGSLGDDWAGMLDPANNAMIWNAGEGRAALLRLVGLVLALGIVSKSYFRARLAPLGAALAASSFAWVGHAHGLHPNTLPVLILSVHLLGAAFWLGSLWPLMQITRYADHRYATSLVERFSSLALKVVAALLLAGALLLVLLLPRVSDLWSSDYGRLILLKLMLVAGLLAIATFNKMALTPRLSAGDVAAYATLRRSIASELLIGGVILVVTALFTTLTGPPH
jgi:copper resistance protein D